MKSIFHFGNRFFFVLAYEGRADMISSRERLFKALPWFPRSLCSTLVLVACGVAVSKGYEAPNSIDQIGKDGNSTGLGHAFRNRCQMRSDFNCCLGIALAFLGLVSRTFVRAGLAFLSTEGQLK